MTHDFDEREYARQLVVTGVSPAQAADVARRTAEARGRSRTPSLVQAGAVTEAITGKLGAIQEKPAKRAAPRKATESAPLTKKERELLALHADLEERHGTIEDASFFHISMCQVALPRSLRAVKGLDVFERTSGTSSIRVEAGSIWSGEEWVKQHIPYGSNPRLLMAYMNTFSVRERTKIIPLGDSWRDLLSMLGKSSTGGRNGSLTRLKADMQAIAACKMLLGYVRNGSAITYDGKPVKEFRAWIGRQAEGQRSLFPAMLTFSDDYYNALTDERMAVPVDMRALIALSGSALAMDVYLMLAERLYRMTGRGRVLYWHQLRAQFGQEYTGKNADKTFKNNFKAAFRQVELAYPQCKAKPVEKGLLLVPSAPPVALKV